ncbi:MAG: hypothetical protein FJ279_20335, partial [Planctomycetes bacterium]|nr:hypothetical protein [Planctomycetota bacterium]
MVNYQLSNIRTQVAELAGRLRGILTARDEALTGFDAQRRRDEKLFKSTCERLKREFQEERQRLETQGTQDLERLAGEHKRNTA